MSELNPFDASASALGYAYQFRYSLWLALQRVQGELDWYLALEAADDVEISGDATNTLLQLKHRNRGNALTDADPDFWKTLRIWIASLENESPTGSDFLLVTTGEVAVDSTAYFLEPHETQHRDVGKALQQMRNTEVTSKNQANSKAYEAFRGLTNEQQLALVDRIQVLASQDNIELIEEKLTGLAVLMAGREFAAPLLQRLEGWWFGWCVGALSKTPSANSRMSGFDFDGFLTELRSGLRPDSLPIDFDLAATENVPDELMDRRFVKQLHLIGAQDTRINYALRDYYRAFTQRSRWVREHLITGSELAKYERNLVEAWQLRFARMAEDLGSAAAEEEKLREARELYAWVEDHQHEPVRPACSEPFIGRGSYHHLADELRVGWHPDFEARLMALLEPVGGEQ